LRADHLGFRAAELLVEGNRIPARAPCA
jgi:hypothetical protein